jgi:hypothetical protein
MANGPIYILGFEGDEDGRRMVRWGLNGNERVRPMPIYAALIKHGSHKAIVHKNYS